MRLHARGAGCGEPKIPDPYYALKYNPPLLRLATEWASGHYYCVGCPCR